MKLLLKALTGVSTEIEVEPSCTILDVKRRVEDDYEPSALRLVYNGAVLQDTKTLAELQITDGTTLVLTGRKRKIPKPPAPVESAKITPPAPQVAAAQPVPAAPTSEPSPAPVQESVAPVAVPSVPEPATDPAVEAPAPPPSTATVPAAPTVPAAAAAPAAEAYGVPSHLVDEVISMGFEDRLQVALALRAAFLNPERAVEYLFDGIPPRLAEEVMRANAARFDPSQADAAPPSQATTITTTTTTAAAPLASTPASPADELRAALATIPQFDQIRALYVQNPDTMAVVMQQISQRHPNVYAIIERDPETFLAIMAESPDGAGQQQAGSSSGGVAPSTATGVAPEEEGGLLSRMPAELELTEEDRTAVRQLVELGGGMWDEQGALLVYLATQRNQEVAASILFEHGGVPSELLAEIANQMAEEDEEDDDPQ